MKATIHPAVFLFGCIAFCALWLSVVPVEPPPSPPGVRRSAVAERATVNLDSAILERYVGHYEGRADFTVDLSVKDGRLYIESAILTWPWELLATAETKFFLKESPDVAIEFRVDGRGAVTGFDAATPYGLISLDRAR
jgi:hypothetical protein